MTARRLSVVAFALLALPGCSSTEPGAPDAGYSTPPASVDAGTLVRFRVDVADGGTVVLRSGPYGMIVDPDGTVSWRADLPLFGQALDVHWAVGLRDGGAGVAGTIRVVDASRPPVLLRSGFEIPLSNAGLRVIDLDGDGIDEVLMASRTGLYSLARSDGGFSQSWMLPFPPGGGLVSAVAAADLDGDHRPEIALSMSEVLVVLDGATRSERGRVDLPTGHQCDDLAFTDLDRNGTEELICLEIDHLNGVPSGRLRIFDALTLAPSWETEELPLGEGVAIGNVDADPALELVTSGGFVFDGVTHAIDWAYDGGFGSLIGVGDLDGDGVAEIIGASSSQGVNTLRALSGVDKSGRWEVTTSLEVGALLVVDLDGDRRAEIVTGEGNFGEVIARRYVAATSSLETLWSIGSQGYGVSALGAGDLDGDHLPEVTWGTNAGSTAADQLIIAGRDGGMTVRWTHTDPTQLDGPFMGGQVTRVGAGTRRLLFEVPRTDSAYAGARLVLLDPVGGAWSTTPELGSNWGAASGLAVADLDGDGIDEAFLGTAELYNGYVGSWDFARSQPGLGLPSGTLVALAQADLNGDGHVDFVGVDREGITRAWDFWNQTSIWESEPGQFYGPGQAVAAVDLDGDGVAEIVALFETRLSVFRRTSSAPPTFVEKGIPISGADLVVADLDGDGKPEIAVLGGSASAAARVSRYSPDLELLGQFDVDEPARCLALEDLGAGRRNLVLGIGDPPSRPLSDLRAVDPVSGALVWRSPALWSPAACGSIGYWDLGEGRAVLVFGTWTGMYVVR